MEVEGSPEPIDFNFFDDDDKEARYDKKTSSRRDRDRYDDEASTTRSRHDRPSSGRADSVRSTASSRSSLSVKIPSANASPRERKTSYSSDEDYSPKHVNGTDNYNKTKSTKRDKKSSRSRSDSGGSEPSKSTRPKTSKSSRNRNSSGSSSASKSSKSSLGSRSSKSDDYSSSHSSDSESVTDVSPMQSPVNSRSPSPTRLKYNDDEMNSSPERKGPRNKNQRKQAKDSVRFKEPVSPRGGCVRPPASERSTGLAGTEAQELSMLLRAVLEMEETPQRPDLHLFEDGVRSRPSSGKRPMSGKSLPHQRMNMSFSNDEVRRIDKDNQRLLQNIMSPPSAVPSSEKKRPQSGRMRTRSASYGSKARPSSGHVSHSAILRQKEQRRIEMENMKILQRIDSAKPTSELQYHKLKKDFSKQQQYAAQVSKTPVRPSSAKRSGNGFPSGHSSHGMSKASSMQSLRSDFSQASVSTAASSRNRSRPSSASRPTWDDHWSCT